MCFFKDFQQPKFDQNLRKIAKNHHHSSCLEVLNNKSCTQQKTFQIEFVARLMNSKNVMFQIINFILELLPKT
jgi:hypothetical protein